MDDRTDTEVIADLLVVISEQLAEIIKYQSNILASLAKNRDVLNAILRKLA